MKIGKYCLGLEGCNFWLQMCSISVRSLVIYFMKNYCFNLIDASLFTFKFVAFKNETLNEEV